MLKSVGYEDVAGLCFIIVGKFIDELSDCLLHKKDLVALSWLVSYCVKQMIGMYENRLYR
jgi:hypothetical protein